MNPFARRCLFSFVALALFATVPLQTHAQNDDIDLGGALDAIGKDYANNYTQPLTDALGGGFNGGLFRTASFDGTGLIPGIDLYVGVAAMGTFTSGSSDSFRLQEDEVTTDQGTLTITYPDEDLPTVFGKEESPGVATISDGNPVTPDESVDLPPALVNTSIAPLAVPQIGIGTAFGTDVQVRYLPEREFGDYGSVSLWGLSVRHSLDQYIPAAPLSLAVQGTWQSLGVSSVQQDDILDASGWALNAQLSKSVPVLPVTFYGGLQYEKFTVDVNYTFDTNEGQSEISLSQEAQNNFRALGGVSLSLFLFRINADYALGANNVASVGVGVIL